MNVEQQLYDLAKDSGINYSLDNIKSALELLGNPHLGLKYIHIAGTNGKGTTADFIAQNLEFSGKSVGVYSSPHIFSYTERFQINEKTISVEALDKYIQYIKEKTQSVSLTEFEILTVVAFLFFSDNKPDYVVLETGLGGRLDATNAVDPILTIITTISYDHQSFLGDSLEEIAAEKAGIIKKNVPLITFNHAPEIQDIFIKKTDALSAPITFVSNDNDNYLTSNKALADKAMSLLGLQSTSKTETRIPGRMQIISNKPLIIADAAHNPEGVASIAKYVKKHNLKLNILFSASSKPTKEIRQMLKELSSVATTLYVSNYDYYKAAGIEDLKEAGKNIDITYISEQEAMNLVSSTKDNLIITGSIYFLGKILTP